MASNYKQIVDRGADVLCDDLLHRVLSFLGIGAFICKEQRKRDLSRSYTLDTILNSGEKVIEFIFPTVRWNDNHRHRIMPDVESRGFLMGDIFLHSIMHENLLMIKAIFNHLVFKLGIRQGMVMLSQKKAIVDNGRIDVVEWWMLGDFKNEFKNRFGVYYFMDYAVQTGNRNMLFRIFELSYYAEYIKNGVFSRHANLTMRHLVSVAERHGHHSLAKALRSICRPGVYVPLSL